MKWFKRGASSEPAVVKKQYTCMAEIYWRQLLALKLCAGFMFTGNFYLCALYRAVVFMWAKYIQSRLQNSYQRNLYRSFSPAVLQNVNFFVLFYTVALALASVTTIVSSLKFHKPLMIILNKRFDKRYLENTKAIIQVCDEHCLCRARTISEKSCTSGSGNSKSTSASSNSSGVASATSSSHCLTPMSSISSEHNASSGSSLISKSTPHQEVPPSGPSGRTVQMFNRMNKSIMIRIIIFLYLSAVIWAEMFEIEYSRVHLSGGPVKGPSKRMRNYRNRTMFANETTRAETISQIMRSLFLEKSDMAGEADTEKGGSTISKELIPLNNATFINQQIELRKKSSKDQQGTTDFIAAVWLYYLRTFTFHTLHVLFNFYQIYGQITITLLITATLSDFLRRINEQDQLMMAVEDKNQTTDDEVDQELAEGSGHVDQNAQPSSPGACEDSPRQTGPMTCKRHNQVCSLLLLPTTDILIQTRDILIVLRRVVGIDYLAIQTFDTSQLIVLFGSIMAIISVNKVGFVVICSVDYIRVVLCIILTRITYYWLHVEARKIRLCNEERLINSNLNLSKLTSDNERGARKSAAGSSIWSTNLNSSEEASRYSATRSKSGGANQSTSITDQRGQYVSRIEAITNYRLAKEIEQMWPTDWFEPDLKSCLSLNLFVATFVATLQQLVEASVKVSGNQASGG